MVLSVHLVFPIFVFIGKITAQNYYVAAPKSLRLNSDEIIGVAADGNRRGPISIYIQDYPGKIKNITSITGQIDPGKPQLFKVRLDTENFPSGFLSSPGFPKYVHLSAHFQNYYKELLIPINEKYGYIFIQTDKPIYTPKGKVLFRIISLNESSLPSDETFQLQIRNPNNSIVDQKLFDGKKKGQLNKVSVTHVFRIPKYPVLGEWSATVQYGYNLKQNSTVHFKVKEYVLPTFTVLLETPEMILPKDEKISIKVSAKYVYGKKVEGMVSFRLGIKKPSVSETKFFAIIDPQKLVDGFFNLKLNIEELFEKASIGSFSEIKNSKLIVEALVVDSATGNEEEVVDTKCPFTDTPFHISFKRSLEDFRPGHTSVIEADISYANGEPAEGILTVIEASAVNGQPLEIKQNSAISDKEGKVSFEVRTQLDHKEILITVKVTDEGYFSVASFKQHAFQSTTNSYIALDRMSQTLKANDTFKRIIHYDPIGLSNIYYLVMSKGRIVMMNKLPDGKYGDQHVSFKITYDMVPSFRLLIFAHHINQLLVDSLKIDVENECNPKAEVTIRPEYSIQEPGNSGKIIVRGSSKGTFVGLLGIDEAVYALSKKDILTKSKIFKRLASHDIGCGPGGGLTVHDVLGKAGIILGTNIYTPTHSYSCNERRNRRKRAIAWDIVEMYEGFGKECCSLGLELDIHDRSCEERAYIVEHYLKDEEYTNCSTIFLNCCLYMQRHELDTFAKKNAKIRGYMTMGKTFDDDDLGLIEIDSGLEDDIENKLTLRIRFPETWIFEDLTIGPDYREELRATLPHSITTWVIQAVSVSPSYGICVAEPKKIVSFQKIFLQLNLPYSVVRNEQVEIHATVFNYDQRPIRAVVYMYGAEGLCSNTQPGEKSERQYVTVEGQSAASVIFPVMPLKAEIIPIKVVALSTLGSDAVVRELHVVPEGITKFINIPITLDPTNLQKRQKRSIENSYITDNIDPTQNTQATTVKLDVCLPEDFVPGTESCSISAIGDVFGPAVQTAIDNPEGLLILPTGCGEQNMMKLAPTLYTIRYLKVTGKLTADIEEKGYHYMREGYSNQLNFQKTDGSYSIFKGRESNTWLTAFVMKVFCQATELIYIDEKVICSGVKWLINNQQEDGSYSLHAPNLIEQRVEVHIKVPLTAFVLIALEECKCEPERLNVAKLRAVAYLEEHLGSLNDPLSAAIVAYAFTLGNRYLAPVANNNLLKMAKYDEGTNRMYWTTKDSAQDIQTAGYALLTQLLLNDIEKSTSIVNWLNTKQLRTGGYESTQDTMIALQAMSEYAIKTRTPLINLVAKISTSYDRFRETVMALNDQNAQLLQDIKINKVGGTLLINTIGQGTGSLSVNLRYNVIVPPQDVCKFDIQINVTDTKYEELIDDVRSQLKSGQDLLSLQSRHNKKLKYRISICVRYLGDIDAGMSIVDVGIFSGFQPVKEDLNEIENNASQLIQKIEPTKRGIIFYLTKVPFSDKYCFNFRVLREYIVGNTQMSYVKVYDYYNPGATCTKSYKPISNSPAIRTICEGGICQCAEGGCPSKTPFADLKGMAISDRRNLLKAKFCEDFDYVWKGELFYIRREGGFFNISFSVNEVIKTGIERPELIEGGTRTLLARDNCLTAALRYGTTYLILGKDGEGYMNEHGHIWYRYVLDQTSIIQKWVSNLRDLEDSENRLLQRDLNQVTKILKEEGCDM